MLWTPMTRLPSTKLLPLPTMIASANEGSVGLLVCRRYPLPPSQTVARDHSPQLAQLAFFALVFPVPFFFPCLWCLRCGSSIKPEQQVQRQTHRPPPFCQCEQRNPSKNQGTTGGQKKSVACGGHMRPHPL